MNSLFLFNIIRYGSALSVLVPFIFCVVRIKTLNRELRVLFLYIILSVVIEGFGFFAIMKSLPTYTIENSFTLLECFLISLMFYVNLDRKTYRQMILIFFILFSTLAIYLLLVKNGYDKVDNILNTFEAGFFIILTYSYFYSLLKELNISKLTQYYFIWINSAFLIYFNACFLMFLFKEQLEKLEINQFYLVYSLFLIVNLTRNIMLSIGIWKTKHN